ncbi:lipopolysaccharide heptosyltransferase I [Sulfurimonas autotrophica]|uniref:Lipopolysaccharide heptosyltransferase 1 n=1 Tax=Sulfurimonas autotrophica (strain ATCC BAA-671 / DSM 16294 / JCM 11897 / OK10) TaxID=563040 RepID=E0UPX2_SULAO|nr:lipopolysaccharide heptosyltransferase I [Sulfurimonas autotrophica]ADN09781.1 lipopolysaccharide heptosyltransferase I [Sulfurimonas autotrophica DSM 16294]
MNKDIRKIAIIRLSALGDIINSAVVLQFIKKQYPDAKIDWVSEEIFSDILRTNKYLHAIHSVNLKKLKKSKSFSLLKKTISKLSTLDDYDIIIDMQGLLKSAIVARIIGKNTHGFDKNSTRESLAALFYKTTSSISYEENVIKRNCFAVSDALNFKLTDAMILNKEPVFSPTKEFTLRSDKKNIAFVIGASWPSKIYPKESVVKVCNALQEQCYIIWGNEAEKESAAWICKHSKYATLAPKLTLDGLVSFISSMDLLIGNDTGPTHLAWAQNIPSITLLGPTTTRMIYETPINIGIKSPSKVNILKIDKNDFSIKEIPAEKITQKAKELLHNGL